MYVCVWGNREESPNTVTGFDVWTLLQLDAQLYGQYGIIIKDVKLQSRRNWSWMNNS